ncbi:MAG: DNA polymerase I, partial [Desulfovibrionales bacterium]
SERPMPLKEKLNFSAEPVYLIDGTSFIYRAFYAFPDLTRSDGFPTNAIYILLRILLKVIREEHPEYVGFFLDGKGPTFRHERMKTYKAQRPKMPEPLAKQIPELIRAVQSLGIRVTISKGVEADDCIASIAHRFKGERPVVIVGSDKDLNQCLDHNVVIWDPGQKTERLFTLEEFIQTQSLTPDQWPDFQALVGDKSDNIPGVPGIGPKSAFSLLKRHKSLEGLRDNFDRLTVKEQEKLGPHLESIFLYREMTRLRLDSCPDMKLCDLESEPLNMEELTAFLKEFEFRSLLRELDLLPKQSEQRMEPLGPAFQQREPKLLTESLDLAGEQVGLAVCGNAVRIGHKGSEYRFTGTREELVAMLAPATIATPSLKQLLSDDPLWETIPVDHWFDLSLAAYLLDPEQRDYSWASLRERFGAEVEVHPDDQGLFALQQGEILRQRLQHSELLPLMQDMELPLVPVLVNMERRGVGIDCEAFAAFLKEVRERLRQLTEEICAQAGTEFNLRSSQQLGEILFERLEIKSRKKTPGGAHSTSNVVLEELKTQHPIIPLILEYRTLEKLRSTYLKPMPALVDEDGRLHTTFNNLATATGRLSSSTPNLQNIPIRGRFGPRMRSCFVAASGMHLVAADYSQIELRILAHMSGDPTLLDAFTANEDIHTRTAALLFSKDKEEVAADERRKAKTINFGLLYGMGPQKLGRELGISLKEAKQFIQIYFERLNRVQEFYLEVEQAARETGFVITLFGRRRLLPDINSRNPHLAQQARRMAINAVIQGSAADIIKMAMIQTDSDPMLGELGAKLILQVHDELLLEVPAEHGARAGGRLAEIMSSVYPLSVPLKADWGVGSNWAQAH